METKKRVCRWFTADVASLTDVSRFVREWLSLQGVYPDRQRERYLVELAVIEACTNVIRYAYPASRPGKLGVGLARAGDSIEVLVLDEGEPFDPTREIPPDLRRPQEGGYGIYLMQSDGRIRTAVIAAPSREESRTRRRELPNVTP